MPISKIERAGMPGGAVLQVVSTAKTDTFATGTSATWVDVTGFSATITPSSATSKILVRYSAYAGNSSTSNYSVHFRLVRNGTAIGVGDARGSTTQATSSSIYAAYNYGMTTAGEYLDSPASTSAQTYKVQMFVESGGSGIVGGSWNTAASYNPSTISTITLMEISA